MDYDDLYICCDGEISPNVKYTTIGDFFDLSGGLWAYKELCVCDC